MGDAAREQRFLALVNANRGRLVRIARAYAGTEWNDLHQEILLQIWRGLDSFAQRSSASTWLYRVALNTALTWRRKAAPAERTVVAGSDFSRDPVGATGPQDPMLVLDEFLASLNTADRAILLLYLEDVTYADIAEVTGLSENNVGVRLSRLKRAFMGRYIGD